MSRDLARSQPDRLPAVPASLPPEPVLSPQLSPAVAGMVSRVVDAPSKPFAEWSEAERERAMVLAPVDTSRLSDEAKREARAAAYRFEELLRPATPLAIQAWLTPINIAVRNPQSDGDVLGVATALSILDLPAAAFTLDAQREGMRTRRFFPSVADVAQLIEPVARRWRAKHAACLNIANGPRQNAKVAPSPWTRPTMEECAHASAQVAALKRDLAGRANATGGRTEQKVQPRHLTPAQLQLACQQRIALGGPGAEGARVRLEHLRRQFGDLISNTGGARA